MIATHPIFVKLGSSWWPPKNNGRTLKTFTRKLRTLAGRLVSQLCQIGLHFLRNSSLVQKLDEWNHACPMRLQARCGLQKPAS
jgi:hypothetical protein